MELNKNETAFPVKDKQLISYEVLVSLSKYDLTISEINEILDAVRNRLDKVVLSKDNESLKGLLDQLKLFS